MSAKFLGIGLLSLGGLIVGAAGGYLAMKTDIPAPTEVVAAPIPTPAAPIEAPLEAIELAPAASGRQVEAKAAIKPDVREATGSALPRGTSAQAGKPSTKSEASSVAVQTTPAPAAQPTPTPVSDPPASTPVPVSAETPRYVPEPQPATSAANAEPRRQELEELIVSKHSVIGIRLDAPVSTRTARVEDRVTATVSRDVTVAGRTAIAAGVRLEGSVVLVERGGRFRDRPRLGLQFDRLILADGTRVSLKTDTIYREGDSPSADATAKVGTGAVAGAILGAVIGGKKGAVLGSAAGAAGGVATVMRGEPGVASLTAGSPLTVRLIEDITIPINR